MKIYICIERGIVAEAYVEKDRSDPEPRITVLDVDGDLDHVKPIEEEWKRIAADPAYARNEPEYLDS